MARLVVFAVCFLIALGTSVSADPEWFTFFNGNCTPDSVGTTEGPWSWFIFDDGSLASGERCYMDIADNGSGGSALKIIDNSYDGTGGSKSFKWKTFCFDLGWADNPPCGNHPIKVNQPGCTGGTIAMRFKVPSFTPGTEEATRQRQVIVMSWKFQDTNGYTRKCKLDLYGCSKGGEPDNYNLKTATTNGYKWDATTSAWTTFGGDWVRGSGGTGAVSNVCNNNWHTIWLRVDTDPHPDGGFPPDNPYAVHYKLWIDNSLRQEWWGSGQDVASGSIIPAHQGDGKIEFWCDYYGFSFQPADPGGIPIPADTTTWTSNKIGEAKKFADGARLGTSTDGKITDKLVVGKWELPSVQNDSQSSVVSSGNNLDDVIFIEEDDRSAGMLVRSDNALKVDTSGNGVSVNIGDRVDVYGALFSPHCDKSALAWKIVRVAANTSSTPVPLEKTVGLTNKSIVQSWNNVALTPGTAPNDGKGLDNLGLTVTLWGKVTFIDEAREFCFVDDGTGYKSGSVDSHTFPPTEIPGIKVFFVGTTMPDGIPYLGETVKVIGNMGTSRFHASIMGIDPINTIIPTVWAQVLDVE